MWPPKCRLIFKDGRDRVWLKSTNRKLDLSDTLMHDWNSSTRTVYLSLSTESRIWKTWSKDNVEKIESLIRYDLNFDAYNVSIKRLSKFNYKCRKEFTWKLSIRPMGGVLKEEEMPKETKREQNPSRFRLARNDASIESIQRTIESKFGIPAGSVRLVNPNGRKIRANATVGTLRENWDKNG